MSRIGSGKLVVCLLFSVCIEQKLKEEKEKKKIFIVPHTKSIQIIFEVVRVCVCSCWWNMKKNKLYFVKRCHFHFHLKPILCLLWVKLNYADDSNGKQSQLQSQTEKNERKSKQTNIHTRRHTPTLRHKNTEQNKKLSFANYESTP